MEILPIDVTGLIATILGISIVLVPVVGLTARFAFKPVVEALSRLSEDRTSAETLQILRRRVELQDHEIEAMQTVVEQLRETSEFDRQLWLSRPAGGPEAHGGASELGRSGRPTP